MRQINIRGASIEMLQVEMGHVLGALIDQWGDKSDFAKEAGINRATLYRLLGGENTGTDTLFRVLRTLGRYNVLALLIEPVTETPLEKLQKYQNMARTPSARVQSENVSEKTVLSGLKLGKKNQEKSDE